jgi:ABC-type lipoprotein release transport system permease subunit
LTLARFAARNVLRNTRRSLLTVLSMAGGLFVLVLLKGLQDGYVAQRLDAGLGLSVGHLVVRPGGGGERAAGGIADGARVARMLVKDPEVIAAAPRIRFEGFAKSSHGAAGVAVVGVDPEAESATTRLPRAVVEGAFLVPRAMGDLPPMVVGKELARRLGVSLGDRIGLLVEGQDGALVAEAFRVVGIFRTGGAFFDAAVAYVPRSVARRMVLPAGDATEVIARLRDALEASQVAARAAEMPALRGLRVQTWREAAPEVLEAMEVLRVMELVRSAVLFALVALGIFNTVTMSVYERRKEFGVLMAIGMRPRAVFTLLVLEVGLLALAGVGLGVGSGMAVTEQWLGQRGVDFSALGARLPGALEGTGVIYPVVRIGNLLVAAAWVLGISVAVLVLPGYRVLRLDPAAALRDRP